MRQKGQSTKAFFHEILCATCSNFRSVLDEVGTEVKIELQERDNPESLTPI